MQSPVETRSGGGGLRLEIRVDARDDLDGIGGGVVRGRWARVAHPGEKQAQIL